MYIKPFYHQPWHVSLCRYKSTTPYLIVCLLWRVSVCLSSCLYVWKEEQKQNKLIKSTTKKRKKKEEMDNQQRLEFVCVYPTYNCPINRLSQKIDQRVYSEILTLLYNKQLFTLASKKMIKIILIFSPIRTCLIRPNSSLDE